MAPRNAWRRGALRLAVLVAVLVGVAVVVVRPSASPGAGLCEAKGKGPTPQAAMNAYLSRCGADYKVRKGPYPGEKRSSAYPNYYGEILEYSLIIKNNPELHEESVLLGQRSKGAPWTTLEVGTGP